MMDVICNRDTTSNCRKVMSETKRSLNVEEIDKLLRQSSLSSTSIRVKSQRFCNAEVLD